MSHRNKRKLFMEKLQIVLFGGGGGAVEIARYITQMETDPATDLKLEISDLLDEGVGRVTDLERVAGNTITVHKDVSTIKCFEQKKFVITLGHTPLREQKYLALKAQGAAFFTVIHPTAQIAPTSQIGEGTVVSPFCLVGELAKLEENIFVNVRCTIGHDVVIGRSSVLSPHTVLSGASECGRSVFFGSGGTVNPGLIIGDHVKLSSGAIVNKDIVAGSFAFGNPAKATKMFNPTTGDSILGE